MRPKFILVWLALFFLSACGGGGDVQGTSSAVNETPVHDNSVDRENDAGVSAAEVSNLSAEEPVVLEEEPDDIEELALEYEESDPEVIEDAVEVEKNRVKKKKTIQYCSVFQDTKSKLLREWIEKIENGHIEKRKKKDEKEVQCGAILTRSARLTGNLKCSKDYPVALTVVGDGITLNGKGHTITIPRKRTAVLILGAENRIKNLSIQGRNPKLAIVAYEDVPSNRCQKIKKIERELSSVGFSTGLFELLHTYWIALKSLVLQLFA